MKKEVVDRMDALAKDLDVWLDGVLAGELPNNDPKVLGAEAERGAPIRSS